jgi:putative ABC transport system substrate-binding protein
MRRRDLITLLCVGTASWPFAARGLRSGILYTVGALMPGVESDQNSQSLFATFRNTLAELGWMEGSNLRIELRWGGSDPALFARCAAELVALGPAVLFCEGTPALEALRRQTSTIPIVFATITDPIGQGFVASLAHPGGNITGFSTGFFSVPGKLLQMLAQITPAVARAAILFNPETTPYADPLIRAIEEAAQPLGIAVRTAPANSVSEVEVMMAELAHEERCGLVVLPSVFVVTHRDIIISCAARLHLPAVYPFAFFAADGGLIAYGIDLTDVHRRSAQYVDRILRGERAADLPVQQSTNYELAINLKTARALDITIAPSLLATADEVIE